MSPGGTKKKGKNSPTEEEDSEYVLLHPEEWKDPEHVIVVEEYHKTPIPGSEEADERDLDAFQKNWDTKGKGQTASEYHKKDAPFMDVETEQVGPDSRKTVFSKKVYGRVLGSREDFTPTTGPEASKKENFVDRLREKATGTTGSVREEATMATDRLSAKVTVATDKLSAKATVATDKLSAKATVAADKLSEEVTKATDKLTGHSLDKDPATRRIIDISTIEVLGYTVFRAMFGKGISVPIKIEGSMDMDISVKDTNVIINTNDVAFEPPVLQIWHFIYAYKGKPVIEFGRGVTRVKVHYYQAFVMLLAMWWGGKKKRKAKEKASRARDKELLARSVATNEKQVEKERMGGGK